MDYQKIYENFKNITGYDIKSYFERFVSFVNTQYPSVVEYYNSGNLNEAAFRELEILLRESNKIEPFFSLYKDTLDNISNWMLLDAFTEVSHKLLTIRNSARWMRSSYTSTRNDNIQLDRVLRSDETFEDISRELGQENPQNDWLSIVTPQYIEEEDYTSSDSRIFKVMLRNQGINHIDSVVDTMSGLNILGKDIDISFSFENDDLKTVSFDKAMEQSLSLILQSMQGAIPEFVEYGLPNEFIGTNVSAFQYSAIFKSIMNMFQRDSRWKSVELMDVSREEDSIFLKIKATSVSNNDYIVKTPI